VLGQGVEADLPFIERYGLAGVRVLPDPDGRRVGLCRNRAEAGGSREAGWGVPEILA